MGTPGPVPCADASLKPPLTSPLPRSEDVLRWGVQACVAWSFLWSRHQQASGGGCSLVTGAVTAWELDSLVQSELMCF